MVGEKTQPKRLGRPPKSAERPKNGSFTFRIRPEMREELEGSAKTRGLSISEEIERRIGFAFDMAPDPETEVILRSVSLAIRLSHIATGKKWSQDKSTAVIVCEAIGSAGSIVLSPHINSELKDNVSVRASEAGKAIGGQSIGMYFGLSDDELRLIGGDAVTRFQLTQAGVEESDLDLAVALMEARRRNSADQPPAGQTEAVKGSPDPLAQIAHDPAVADAVVIEAVELDEAASAFAPRRKAKAKASAKVESP